MRSSRLGWCRWPMERIYWRHCRWHHRCSWWHFRLRRCAASVPVCIEDEAATGSCSAGIAGRAGDAHYDLNRSRIPIRASAAVAKRFSETMGNRKLSAFPDYVNMELAFSCGKFGITEVRRIILTGRQNPTAPRLLSAAARRRVECPSRHFLPDHFPRPPTRHLLLPAREINSAPVPAAWYRDRNSVPERRRAARAYRVRRFVLAPPPESDLRGGWWKAGAR